MKKILAVNIESIPLGIISTMLTNHTSEFEILTSTKIGEIDDIVKKLTADIVIIDLENPAPQDLKILGYLSKSYPRLPLIVMTAFETAEIEAIIKSIGTVRYFEKPVDYEQIVGLINQEFERGVGGEIHGISLTSFLQMSEMEKASCTLKIKTDKKSGALYLLKGALIAAEAEDLKNEEAVFEILSWEKPAIEIDKAPANKKKEIQSPLISLLMEGVKRKDEKKERKKSTPATAAETQKDDKKTGPIVAAAEKPPKKKAALPKTEKQAPKPETAPLKPEELGITAKVTDAAKALKRKQLITLAFRILASVAILALLFLVWQYAVNPWLTERKFNKAIAAAGAAQSIPEKISILDEYLASGPESGYAAKAETIKRSYASQEEAQEFEKTIKTVRELPMDDNFQTAARESYLQFLKKFPDSEFKDQINQMIDSIPLMVDDAAYTRLINIPENHYSERINAYKSYLSSYPDSVNAANVKDMMDGLGQAFYKYIKKEKAACDRDKKWTRCLNLCQYFLDNIGQHEQAGNVAAWHREITARIAYIKIAQQVKEAGPLSKAAGTILEKYLQEHPDSPVRETVESQLAAINQKQNRAQTWQQLIAYVKDNQNDIFDRVNRMENYLTSQKPPGEYKEEAENIYAWLLREKEKTLRQIGQQAETEKAQKRREARIEQERRRITSQIQQSEGRYAIIRQDTVTDNQTGLTWCLLDSSVLSDNCLDYKSAQQYVAGLDTGGYNDWRLPDTSELMVIYNSRPGFPVNDTRWYWTSEAFTAAWQKKVNTVIRTDAGIWEKNETDMEKCGAVRAVRP